MTHPRKIPANDQVACSSLKGSTTHVNFVKAMARSISSPLAELKRAPDGSTDKQLLYGEVFRVLDERDGWAFGQCQGDDYVGYIKSCDLGETTVNTHRITSFGGHIYPVPNMKTTPIKTLPLGAQIAVTDIEGSFAKLTDERFMPIQQVSKLEDAAHDFVEVASMFLGVPYLWGGDSNWGIDCSGLVRISLLSAGVIADRDTDMQVDTLGRALDEAEALARGDFIFWKGHIGIMYDEKRLLHANAHHMRVTLEPLIEVAERIKGAGEGSIIRRRRLD